MIRVKLTSSVSAQATFCPTPGGWPNLLVVLWTLFSWKILGYLVLGAPSVWPGYSIMAHWSDQIWATSASPSSHSRGGRHDTWSCTIHHQNIQKNSWKYFKFFRLNKMNWLVSCSLCNWKLLPELMAFPSSQFAPHFCTRYVAVIFHS